MTRSKGRKQAKKLQAWQPLEFAADYSVRWQNINQELPQTGEGFAHVNKNLFGHAVEYLSLYKDGVLRGIARRKKWQPPRIATRSSSKTITSAAPCRPGLTRNTPTLRTTG
jgi:hypothetical protein